MARRRWIADTWNESEAELHGAQAQHLGRVLRAQPGQQHEMVAGDQVRLATIVSVTPEAVLFTLGEPIAASAALPVDVLLAVWKFDRLEWAIEKLTELGVAEIVPVIARRTEKHLAQAAANRVERWRRIAHEAAQQSRRTDQPTIAAPMKLKDALDAERSGARLLLAENERTVMLRDVLSQDRAPHYSLAIGPEGGWADDEESLFSRSAWLPVSLGPRILRAETAAIAGVAVVASSLLG